MIHRKTLGRTVFSVINILLLSIMSLLCIVPFVHLISVSLSSNIAASAGEVKLWPVNFTVEAYKFLGQKVEFIRSLGISIQRVAIGTVINMVLVFITAYPLSKSNAQFGWRTKYVWYFVITMFFGGG
ncbi:putative ABC transporter permease, partial [Paenibacillus agaridevorans]